ncbi:MAG TPA: hypothetical protein DIT67_02230 [Octadecabacter sp.]|nr:hypothetical protein [Octadecabacter sp.]
MTLLLSFIFFALYGISLDAQTLPTLYDVEGVPSGEFLNVREGPSVNNNIVEVISNDDRVEVLWEQDGWGFIGLGEISGWVSMNFLTASPQSESEITLPVTCYGAEPFWSIAIEEGVANYATPEALSRPMTVQNSAPAKNGFTFQFTEETAPYTHTLIARANRCSDGMSERVFGMSALIHMQTDVGNYVHQGCCSFQTN